MAKTYKRNSKRSKRQQRGGDWRSLVNKVGFYETQAANALQTKPTDTLISKHNLQIQPIKAGVINDRIPIPMGKFTGGRHKNRRHHKSKKSFFKFW